MTAAEASERVILIEAESGRYATFADTCIRQMADLLPNQSKDSVAGTLGISANTWLKIKRGIPIRASTAIHLARRLESLGHRIVPGNGTDHITRGSQ